MPHKLLTHENLRGSWTLTTPITVDIHNLGITAMHLTSDIDSTDDFASSITSQVNQTHTKFSLNQLLNQLGQSSPPLEKNDSPIPDVTAFMLFFSHWITQRFLTVTMEGIEHISSDRNHLFISNHRDILLDPTLINHCLLTHDIKAARSVIGSNLMEEPAMATLMKMAGCLEVPRGEFTLKEKFLRLKKLSYEIQEALAQNNIWIAQREGRTKNGIDETNPAIFKMIAMAKDRNTSLEAFLKTQSIIPVAISYQWDPSDTHKAFELFQKNLANNQDHSNVRTDTMKHLIDSLDRCEGNVHIAFGQPLSRTESIEALVQQLNHHISKNYYLFDSHKAAHAYKIKHQAPLQNTHQRSSQIQNLINNEIGPSLRLAQEKLLSRSNHLPKQAQELLIESYANSYEFKT